MSGFKIILVTLTVVVAVYRLARRRNKVGGSEVESSAVKDGTACCPSCLAEVEPGFLECWQCGAKFIEIEATRDSKAGEGVEKSSNP